jgi:hypothetical protein
MADENEVLSTPSSLASSFAVPNSPNESIALTQSRVQSFFAKQPELDLQNSPSIQEMLAKFGSADEKIEIAVNVVKINRKRTKQQRTLVITNVAVYNLKSKRLKHCRRRIPISSISHVTISATSEECVIHVDKSHDYRFLSHRRDELVEILSEQNESLKVEEDLRHSLGAVTRTRDDLRREKLAAMKQETAEYQASALMN